MRVFSVRSHLRLTLRRGFRCLLARQPRDKPRTFVHGQHMRRILRGVGMMHHTVEESGAGAGLRVECRGVTHPTATCDCA